MPRRARVIIPGIAHHITQRGNNRQDVFEEVCDFRNYCYWINLFAEQYHVSVLAYCLMKNHVHFVVVPNDREGLSTMFNTVHMRYAQYINFKKRRSGHLWQGRFFSCVLDEVHLFYAIRYVEQNPVRANIVRHPWNYEWSSAKWHVGHPLKKFIKVKDTFMMDKDDWKQYLKVEDRDVDEQVRNKTRAAKAYARDDFIDFWEKKLNCVLGDVKPGRKRSSRLVKK